MIFMTVWEELVFHISFFTSVEDLHYLGNLYSGFFRVSLSGNVLCTWTNYAISGCQLICRHDISGILSTLHGILGSLGWNGPCLCYEHGKLPFHFEPNYLVHLILVVFCPLDVVSVGWQSFCYGSFHVVNGTWNNSYVVYGVPIYNVLFSFIV